MTRTPPSSLIETIDLCAWTDPLDDAARTHATARLESGAVLLFPALDFPLTDAERALVRRAGSDGTAKNISFDPTTGTCKGSTLSGADLAQLTAMIERFATRSSDLITTLFPAVSPATSRARTSFRPVEIAGRTSSWRKDDTKLHIDAFPSRPMRDRRILRVFTNIDPDGTPRKWRVGPDFEIYARHFLPRASREIPGRAWLLHRLGITKSRRSRYDELMLALHDAAKRDGAWQRTVTAERIDFPPGCTWAVFTDRTAHAALAGRNALEQTFEIDESALHHPAMAPRAILEQLTGRSLV